MIKSIIILILIAVCAAMFVYCVVLKNKVKEAEEKAVKVLENAQKEPIRVEKFVVEPVELHVAFSADYSIYDKMDNDDIQTYIIERLATEFGNAIIENPDLYFVTDSDDLLRMMKHYDAKIRVIPFK